MWPLNTELSTQLQQCAAVFGVWTHFFVRRSDTTEVPGKGTALTHEVGRPGTRQPLRQKRYLAAKSFATLFCPIEEGVRPSWLQKMTRGKSQMTPSNHWHTVSRISPVLVPIIMLHHNTTCSA